MVYLLHFDRPYHHARHYLGSCANLQERLERHSRGQGSNLLAIVSRAGITWELARTWCGGKERERQLKKQLGGSRLCPLCKAFRKESRG